MLGFGSVRGPTRTSLLQVKLLASAGQRSRCTPVPQKHPWYGQRLRKGSYPGWFRQKQHRQHLGSPSLGLCLPALVLAEHGVTAQATGAKLAAWPRASQRSPKRHATAPAQLQRDNFSPDAASELTQSTQIKGCQRLFKATVPLSLGSIEQCMSGASLPCSALHMNKAKSPPACKIYLDEAQERRKHVFSEHVWKADSVPVLGACNAATRENQSSEEKNHASWDFWPPGSPLSCFSFGGAVILG